MLTTKRFALGGFFTLGCLTFKSEEQRLSCSTFFYIMVSFTLKKKQIFLKYSVAYVWYELLSLDCSRIYIDKHNNIILHLRKISNVI